MVSGLECAAESQPAWMMPGNLGAEVHETHTGLVTLVGDRAFKVKKPVRTDFLDFSTAAKRAEACHREVELNRRLAPSSYLGVGQFHPPVGEPEPVVVIRRYPDSERLATLVSCGVPVGKWLMTIAEMLARFHADADRGPVVDTEATTEALRDRWQQNLSELRRHVGPVLAEEPLADIERLAMQYLAGRGLLYDNRIAARRIVDGHGDLLSQDIFCTAEGPVLLDCLEFDDRLRYVDGVDDAAFLAMDLEFLGRRDLADLFLDEYCLQAGDHAAHSLRHFCVAYRAVVRAKVDCVRVGQGHPDGIAAAQRHLAIAHSHLKAGCVQLVVVGGGPGTGKTTIAHALAEIIDAHVISTDEVRRELRQSGDITGGVGDLNAGLYAPDKVSAVYDEVLNRARNWLSAGHSVVLDGTWRDARQRQRAHTVAAETHSPIVELVCTSPVGDAANRIAGRGRTASDATPAMAAELSGWSGEWPSAHPVDTTRPLEESVREARHVCAAAI